MPSRLSSLLVRDGLVGVKRMEKAFQRQVIYGGSLDTTLLEMGLVPEDRLCQYLALASGLPPATRAECAVFDSEAVQAVPQDLAIRHRVAPLCFDGASLRVLVHDPVDMGLLEELADLLDAPVQPLIVPEYRWHVVLTRNYGGQTTARFSTLARAADASPVTSPVGRARSVIVDETPHQVVEVRGGLRPVGPGSPTLRIDAIDESGAAIAAATAADAGAAGADPARPPSRSDGRRHTREVAVAPPPRPPADSRPHPAPAQAAPAAQSASPLAVDGDEPSVPRSRTAEMSTPAVRAKYAETEERRRQASVRRVSTPAPVRESGPTSDGVPTRPLLSGATPPASGPLIPDDDSPLQPAVARTAIASAGDRDHVFAALLRGLRSRSRWAGLLTIQGGAAIGRVAMSEPTLDVQYMSSVLIPLDVRSAFQSTATDAHPFVGPIATGRTDIDVMIARMGGVVPPAALLLPIVLRERCVALAVAHRGMDPISLADVTELLPLAGVTADALGRLIVRSKSLGYRAPTPAPGVPTTTVDADDVATKKTPRRDGAWGVPAITEPAPAPLPAPVVAPAVAPVEPPPPATGTAGTIEPGPPRALDDVLADCESDDETIAERGLTEALDRADDVVPLLADRFPGKLHIDRYQVSGRALRPGQYGGLLELVVRIGAMTADLLIEKMSDTRRDVRFYATVCAAAIRPRSAVYALVERLFDSDYGVRGCAVEALSGYPLRDLDTAMIRARHALHSEDLERVAAATTAIAELADVMAIPDLIDVVGRDSRRGEHARRALTTLTRQDLGTSERKWRKWWEANRERNRIEWLIDALGHKDHALRSAALEDLRRLTGEHFDFDVDLGRRDREGRERWERWWQDSGRRRFVRDDPDERVRPTAVLPARRE